MQRSSFPRFSRELKDHPGPGYHTIYGQTDRLVAGQWFKERSIQCLPSYLDFLSDVGTGRFFAGSLEVFAAVSSKSPVDAVTSELAEEDRSKFFAIGYDGTTEGCYCLNRESVDDRVYWHNWETGTTEAYRANFVQWIEDCPDELFNRTAYAGFKKIRDMAGIQRVLRERENFEVRLLSYDKQLLRPPGKQKDFLRGYNRIVCGIRKHGDSWLTCLTLKVCRLGSPVGANNVEYVTFPLPEFAAREEVRVEAFVFDPFNVPFREMVIDYSPEVDLKSPMRVSFAELKEYL
jgi:hypothetical protein